MNPIYLNFRFLCLKLQKKKQVKGVKRNRDNPNGSQSCVVKYKQENETTSA